MRLLLHILALLCITLRGQTDNKIEGPKSTATINGVGAEPVKEITAKPAENAAPTKGPGMEQNSCFKELVDLFNKKFNSKTKTKLVQELLDFVGFETSDEEDDSYYNDSEELYSENYDIGSVEERALKANSSSVDNDKCMRGCPRIYRPVCASIDGIKVTIANDCEFKNAVRCANTNRKPNKKRKVIKRLHKGECEKKRRPKPSRPQRNGGRYKHWWKFFY